MKLVIRHVGLWIARLVGSTICDAETGKILGKALLFPWRGRILVIGLETPVRPIFLTQERLSYWRQEMGFSKHAPPDYPSLESPRPPSAADAPDAP